ncbi:MAG: hypothetical protein IPN03_21090 [Holophagales bacterium]|nr:hypothetical protein [Holophagales bacterium]
MEDLPAAQPSAPAYQSPTATAQASRRPSPAPPIPTPTVPGALPKSTIVVGVVAVLLAAISSFLAMQWGKLLSLEEAMRGDTAQQMQAIEKLSGEAQGLRQALELLVNGQFVIRNAGRSALHVSGLAAAYRDPATGGFKTFNSASYDYPTWDIRSGGQNLLRFVKGQDVVWDGAVIFYALEVQYEEETYFLSGTWSTVKGKVLELSLDG